MTENTAAAPATVKAEILPSCLHRGDILHCKHGDFTVISANVVRGGVGSHTSVMVKEQHHLIYYYSGDTVMATISADRYNP